MKDINNYSHTNTITIMLTHCLLMGKRNCTSHHPFLKTLKEWTILSNRCRDTHISLILNNILSNNLIMMSHLIQWQVIIKINRPQITSAINKGQWMSHFISLQETRYIIPTITKKLSQIYIQDYSIKTMSTRM